MESRPSVPCMWGPGAWSGPLAYQAAHPSASCGPPEPPGTPGQTSQDPPQVSGRSKYRKHAVTFRPSSLCQLVNIGSDAVHTQTAYFHSQFFVAGLLHSRRYLLVQFCSSHGTSGVLHLESRPAHPERPAHSNQERLVVSEVVSIQAHGLPGFL